MTRPAKQSADIRGKRDRSPGLLGFAGGHATVALGKRGDRIESFVAAPSFRRRFAGCLLGLSAISLLAMFQLAGCSKSKTGKKQGAEGKAGNAGAKSRSWPAPKQVWRLDQTSLVAPLELVGNVVVAARYSRSRLPRHLLGIDESSGKVLWETKTLLAPALVRRASPWGMCWAKAEVGGRLIFAYQRPRGRVTALDARTGDRLWTAPSEHGVAFVPAGMALSDGKTIEFVDPLTGRKRLSLDLSLPALGGGAQGVASGLKKKTCLQALGKLVLVTRRDGGELQAIDPQSGKLAWRFSEPESLGRHVLKLPLSGNKLFLPVGYPDPRRLTVLMAWKSPVLGGKPFWVHAFGGKTFRRWVWTTGESVLALYEDGAKRRFLVRLQRETGKPVYRVQIPSVRDCVLSEGRLACESAGKILVYRVSDGKEAWQASVGTRRDRLRKIAWAGSNLVAVTAGKMVALDGKTGKAVWSRPKKLRLESTGAVPVRVVSVLGESGGLIFTALRTRQEEARLDRIYLVAFSGEKVAWKRRLGPVPPRTRPNRINANDVDLKLPLVFSQENGKPRIFSAVGGNAVLLDGATGKVLRGFTLPGRKDRPTVMYDLVGSQALLERGGMMMAMDAREAKILWRKAVGMAEVTHFGQGEAFFVDAKGEVSWIGGPGRTKLPSALSKLLAARNAKVAFASGSFLFARTPKNVLVVRRDGTVVDKLRRTGTFFSQGGLIFGLQRRLKHPEVIGAYVALDAATGKVLWRKKVHVHAQQGELPAPVLVERRWPVAWTRQAGDVFVTTDALGRCLVAVEAGTGARRWVLCFDRIAGPPAVASGYLLLAARGRPHGPQDATSSVRGNAGASSEASLYAVQLSSGKAVRLADPPAGHKIVFGSFQPDRKGFFVYANAPSGRRQKGVSLLGVALWPKQ